MIFSFCLWFVTRLKFRIFYYYIEFFVIFLFPVFLLVFFCFFLLFSKIFLSFSFLLFLKVLCKVKLCKPSLKRKRFSKIYFFLNLFMSECSTDSRTKKTKHNVSVHIKITVIRFISLCCFTFIWAHTDSA